MNSLVEAFASKLGGSWLAVVLTPSFLFWLGGLGTWLWAQPDENGYNELRDWFLRQEDVTRWMLVIGGLLLVSTSAIVVSRISFMALRLMEGYWPRFLNGVRARLTTARNARLSRAENRIQELQRKDQLSTNELQELGRLETVWSRAPADPTLRMPTALGNIIRAGEGRPLERYGLDAVVCWHRLWLILPQQARAELQDARGALDADVVGSLWGALFLVWTPFSLWAIPIALVAASIGYRAALISGSIYSDLLEACFDLYRWDLYEALAWPLPKNPAEEQEAGGRLTQYLWRGSVQSEPTFVREVDA